VTDSPPICPDPAAPRRQGLTHRGGNDNIACGHEETTKPDENNQGIAAGKGSALHAEQQLKSAPNVDKRTKPHNSCCRRSVPLNCGSKSATLSASGRSVFNLSSRSSSHNFDFDFLAIGGKPDQGTASGPTHRSDFTSNHPCWESGSRAERSMRLCKADHCVPD
jgi:hypothetical protein